MDPLGYDDLTFDLLNADCDLSSFLCRELDLEEFLKMDALQSQQRRLSATRLVLYHGTLVGYYTLVNDSIVADAVQSSDGESEYPYRKYPALKVARLAVHLDYERRGIGRSILLKILSTVINLSRHTGCRIITVDSKGEAVGFYKKMGYVSAMAKAAETVPLYLDFHRFVTEVEESAGDNAFTAPRSSR